MGENNEYEVELDDATQNEGKLERFINSDIQWGSEYSWDSNSEHSKTKPIRFPHVLKFSFRMAEKNCDTSLGRFIKKFCLYKTPKASCHFFKNLKTECHSKTECQRPSEFGTRSEFEPPLYWTSLDFEWSKLDWLVYGPVFEWSKNKMAWI